ncbi:MAG TPA: GNAT family N-acetyltransferase [Candidatus Bathyarchaeia archaeon]|nr:GNAT family N-acetyltransferase [Candidatus Bathyarchaeia archaeon]
MSELVVKELTPSLRDDFLLFFDHIAFAENPEWADCYCYPYHFSDRGKVENRREASNQIEERRIQGFLAYHDGNPVGWCNAANRDNYPALHRLMRSGQDQVERVGSIVCFVVAPSHRSKRVASRLLNAACEKFSNEGLEYAEAYPVNKPTSAADNFPGPLSMYTRNGFTTHRNAGWYVVVRKLL